MTKGPYIGAHVSASGGLSNAILNAIKIDAESIQIFPGAPQVWKPANHTHEEIEKFKSLREHNKIHEVWLHNIYLANMAADNSEQLDKSINSVVHALNLSSKINGAGVVLHTGSHKGKGFNKVQRKVISSLKKILSLAPGDVKLALENSAGQGGAIGGDFSELYYLIDRVNDQRLGVCLDTCHAFAAGYDLRKKDEIDKIIQGLQDSISVDKLFVVHANDSLMDIGSNKDRHENINEGYIGNVGFKNLLHNKFFRELSFILEVPGFQNKSRKSKGPDIENVERLKSLLK